ncbi:hypothetical protein Y032_0002g913 [Ancylostoma ceylanicum]|uniref:Uncharacterized protein n=1 Tax=Ancylostoma ceylanicum TaxID=53326 RepID=A0A016W240_9BILA|nr:hypothetical protein Y032_0002g913 [Ancylostoma ceylanicum]
MSADLKAVFHLVSRVGDIYRSLISSPCCFQKYMQNITKVTKTPFSGGSKVQFTARLCGAVRVCWLPTTAATSANES